MKVLGRPLADSILFTIKDEVVQSNLEPHLAVILAGDHPASRIYIKHKINAAQKAGIKLTVFEFTEENRDGAIKKINSLNNDNAVHGIIVQLPLFQTWNTDQLVNAVQLEKDVDGFRTGSPYTAATAAAIWEMVSEFARLEKYSSTEQFLDNKNIVVLGKGRTAGAPFRELLSKKGFSSTLIDSKTENPNEILLKADLVISATGRKHLLTAANTKENAYIISVGVGKEVINGVEKVFGDIDEESIDQQAKLYCPTIGGIGPLTVACLLRNVVASAHGNHL
jgi:methylenetetrahydrofolate dehydrogenase (NADP+)/methenyltetrahydrofolate cyclohydrolase